MSQDLVSEKNAAAGQLQQGVLKMNTGHAVGLSALFMFGISVVSAEPMKELDVYKGGLGKWTCNAKELGSGKTFKAIAEFSVEFDGQTYIERYYEIASADHPNAWKGIFLMSYDPQSQRWVRNGLDNSGDRNAASSAGWKDDTWVWENAGVNIVIIQKGTNARDFAIDLKDGGDIKRVVEANCTRT
jgi:hypothetical protein